MTMIIRRRRTTPLQASHMIALHENLQEVRRILEIHSEVTGTGPGYKHNVEVLNKSGVILLVACWEAFVEDLASSSFGILLSRATKPEVFPSKILSIASKKLKESTDNRDVWKLADSGWKDVLKEHKESILSKHIGIFNTPRAEKIDQLFEELIGLKNLSKVWCWRSMSKENAKIKIDKLITLRGSIAHRVSSSEKVHKIFVSNHITFIRRLAVKSHNKANEYLFDRTKEKVWRNYKISI